MKILPLILILLLGAGFVSAISAPMIREVYTPDPIIMVIFNDPTNITVTSYALAEGFVELFQDVNETNESEGTADISFVELNPPERTDNEFIFEPVERLDEGNFTFKITAEDVFGNTGTFYSKFTIKELPFNVSIIDPSFGVGSSKSIDLGFDTFIDAECVYSSVDTSFENSKPFVDNGNIHTFSGFNLLNENVEYPLYVKCKNNYNDIAAKQFFLSYDTSPPIIESLEAPDTWNNKVVEPIRIATLQVITDEDARCEYSQNGASFVKFSENFSTNNSKKFIGLEDLKTHSFKVKCMNKAELYSDEQEIELEVNTGLGLGIDVISPTPFMSDLSFPFIISTSKSSSCSLAEGDNDFNIPLTQSDGLSHTYAASFLSGGNYSYQVGCSYLGNEGYDFLSQDINFVIDVTSPIINNVTDEGTTSSLSKLEATVDAEDPESGVKDYYFAIGTLPSNQDIKNWTRSSSSSLSGSGLNLSNGSTYYFSVIVGNGAGMNSSVVSSSGVLVDTSYTPSSTSPNATAPVSRLGCVVDEDGDGYGLGCVNGKDCDDTNPAGNLGNCGNGCIQDSDGDNYGVGCYDGRDCNDLDETLTFPCENMCRIDTDGDGYGPGCSNGPDCDDFDASKIGSCDSGIGCSNDNDCDGIDDAWESENGLNSDFDDSLGDPDNDGISNLDEYRDDSNPNGAGSSSSTQKPQQERREPEPEESGFDFMFIIIVLVIILLLGFGGYYVYTNYVAKKPSGKSAAGGAYPGQASGRGYSGTAGSAQGYAQPRKPSGPTPAQRRAAAAKKTRALERERMSKQRSSFFDVFAPAKSVEEPKPKTEPKITPVGKKILRKARTAPKQESSEFKGLSNLLSKGDDFEKLGSLKKEEKDVFNKIKSLDERHLDKLDSMIKEKGMNDNQVFDALSKVGSDKSSRDEFVNKLDSLINKKKGKR